MFLGRGEGRSFRVCRVGSRVGRRDRVIERGRATRSLFSGRPCPGRALLSFACPKESNQRERAPRFAGRPVGRLPCVARHAGRRIRTRAIRCAATRSNMNPPTAPGAAALLGGSQGPQKRRGASSRSAFYLTFYLRSTLVSNRARCSAGFQPATTQEKL